MKTKFLLLLPLLLSIVTVSAQVPQILNYQGRISVGSANFTGSGQFEFALVNTNGSTTYWSNDGTNGQPTKAVTLTVTNGLYSVLLGDTTIANMTAAIPYSVFTNPDVRLRVWFNDGTHGNQQLGPDQRLSASGYALMAGGVNLPVTTSATNGTLEIGGSPFLHAYGQNGLGDGNIFVGDGAGNFSLTGTDNTATGSSALSSNTSGQNNTGDGFRALYVNTAGSGNTALGNAAMFYNTTAGRNVAVGQSALFFQGSPLNNFNNGGIAWNSNNVAVGYNALNNNLPSSTTTGVNNTAVGTAALLGNTSGANNIGIGNNGGSSLTIGSNNIDIGNVGVAGESNIIRIGDGSTQTDTYLTGTIHGNGSGLTGITSSGLAAGSVTNTQLAANSVTATDIVSGAVGSTQLASGLTLGGTTAISGDLNLPVTTSASTGVLEINGSAFLHAYGHNGLGDGNTFGGVQSGNFSLTGTGNTGFGFSVLIANTSGSGNTATGYGALVANQSGSNNTANGFEALFANNSGASNTAIGNSALSSNTSGAGNTATGYDALYANSTGGSNTAEGYQALYANTKGGSNTVTGFQSLYNNTTAGANVALGYQALYSQSYGNINTAFSTNNVALGYQAMYYNQPTSSSTGLNNTAVGTQALEGNSTGNNNIGIGFQSGQNLTTGSNNIDIGSKGVAGESNTIRIGDGSTQTSIYLTGFVNVSDVNVTGTLGANSLSAGSTTSPIQFLGHTSIKYAPTTNTALACERFGSSEICANFLTESNQVILTVGGGGYALYAYKTQGAIQRSDGASSWDTPSDERIKHDIKPVTSALATLARLRPVRFHYNADFLSKMGGTPDYERFGVVAQEFQRVFPDFVDTDKDGMLSIRMDPIPIVTAAAVQELDAADKQRDATVANLQAENAALKKQVAQLQADDKDRDARLARLEKLLPTK